jgi:hypothetical protein
VWTVPETRDLAGPYRIAGYEGSVSDWLDDLERMYREVVGAKGVPGIRLWGRRVLSSGDKAPDGRDRTFWHLVTHSTAAHSEDSRELDLMRASLLPRVWDLLERLAIGDPRAVWWQEARGPRQSSLNVASVDFGIHVVLISGGGVFVLKTAYPLVKRSQRAKLTRRAARSWQAGDSRRDAFAHYAWRRTGARGHPWPAPRHAERWEWI